MKWLLYLTWLICAVAMLGSLFFSEVMHIAPCDLCWWQRICIYPLAFILAIAAHQGFFGIAPYVFPSILANLLISGYQVSMQLFPGWHPINACGSGPSCSEKISIGLGPITIPMLSFAASIVLFVFICIIWIYNSARKHEPSAP